jgi:hypothetical protein
MRYMTESIFYNRAIKNGIVFETSTAAYDNDKMVGYTLVGIGPWKNTVGAFDISTGIIKPFRGQGIVTQMFDVILKKLQSKGIHKFVLEVLQSNAPAIKAYEKTGFQKMREFDCFKLDFNKMNSLNKKTKDLVIKPIKKDQLSAFQGFLDWPPSWENSFAAVNRIPDEVVLLSAAYQGQSLGLLAYYPALNWIMCLAVYKPFRRMGIAAGLSAFLFKEIQPKVPMVKMVNVLHSDDGTICFLKQMGFEVFTNQFEMEMDF